MESSPYPSTSPLNQAGQPSYTGAGRTSFRDPTSDPNLRKSFWSILAKRAKAALLDDGVSASPDLESREKQRAPETSNVQLHPLQTKQSIEGKPKRIDAPALQKGFQAIASSISVLSGTIGNALEEGLNIVETKASDLFSSDSHFLSIRKKVDPAKFDSQQGLSKFEELRAENDTQLEASRDVAMAMAAKAKLLMRELKTVNADLTFAKERCIQLEEENRRLRDSLASGVRSDDEDLVRAQLETLLAEKARLAQENAYYARENQFLREVVEYHQLTMQDVVLLDESMVEAVEMANEPTVYDESLDELPEKVISMVSG